MPIPAGVKPFAIKTVEEKVSPAYLPTHSLTIFFFFLLHVAERHFFTCLIMKTTSLFVPVLTAAFVSAHGFLRTVTINNQAYTGNVPLAVDNPSIIRQVVTPFPNKGASNPALTCGPNSTTAALVANANPGDSLTFSWKGADLSNVSFLCEISFFQRTDGCVFPVAA